ncbi:hypothetical protein BCR35DRAFT_303239 [Leucosporidium creatinivorum]|uniref:Uncharacterized protein n=1 Tax=Leucosporidium creatinivorum TaxID=106004 RepID=A0A1Y2FN53_9BASI|nr:hypothetical protein BCR35DRAFT_303239 [Leucosporidium creatinivorum]
MPSFMLNLAAPTFPSLDSNSETSSMLQDALFSPFSLPPPLPRGPHLHPLEGNDLQQPLSSPATLEFPAADQEVSSAMVGVTTSEEEGLAAGREDDEVRQRREEGERRFREAQELAAARRRATEDKENGGAAPSRMRSASSSPVKSRRTSPVGVREMGRRASEAWEAQMRLHDEARWSGRAFGGAGWYALLGEGAEWYSEESVVWVRAGEDEMSIRNMERLKAEAQRGNSAAVYLIWKTVTREAYYQKAGITDARVARQLVAEHGNDPRAVDRAIELEDDLPTKQHVADLLLSLSG